jgi:hypothetical protein
LSQRPKIAALVTTLYQQSHAQHIVDRFLEGYGWNGRHHRPAIDLVSLYVDQIHERDLALERAARFPSLTIYPTIADALTLGGAKLAVDGVLLIGEQGDYPENDKLQKLYPRYEFFKQMAAVFRASGRSVPVFNDKHLSWNWNWAQEMYDISQELGFAFMAGSSLPVTRRIPAIDLPLGAKVKEAMCVGCGWIDGGHFHAFETIQAMVERRAGYECGVKWMQTFRGEDFWQAHATGRWSRQLFEAGMCRSHKLMPARAGFNHLFPTLAEMRQRVDDPIAYQYEHLDGLKCTLLSLNGLLEDLNFVARIEEEPEPLSTSMHLPAPDPTTTLANFFSPLVNNIETMLLSGKASYPVERTLLTTGLTAVGAESLHQGQKKIETPHLHIAYQPNPESTYWRT